MPAVNKTMDDLDNLNLILREFDERIENPPSTEVSIMSIYI